MGAPVGEVLADDRVHVEGVYGGVLGLPAVDAAQALADLVEISSQIEAAVLADGSGAVLASTLGDDARAQAIATEARELLQGAAGPAGEPTQVEVAFHEGCVFVVTDGERLVAAVTGRDPTAGLVFYDLKTCLRLSGEEAPAKKAAASTRSGRKKAPEKAPEPEVADEA
jgi:predicted regulator of Ras-like GTPase activity (Roadblock/LC7/MglB family)